MPHLTDWMPHNDSSVNNERPRLPLVGKPMLGSGADHVPFLLGANLPCGMTLESEYSDWHGKVIFNKGALGMNDVGIARNVMCVLLRTCDALKVVSDHGLA
ncbi:hypothetical protein AMAG_08187 [Allomyces macrogynus ATCC 38327]|uniref:Uncharacterized protein n=1 Tax=Allomyces macrogynus (strain ATCC 38327) TaxID=578462 RepID=A0A0L0SKW9_ALLM3|nr:hypothetical protein AMAG_08187 [Allomyces macrogynus ATCC 38327]|eukprot:KNE63020.1 hypothetical protein AMAG_08187 [Allomyces macrogynus ATCC 38327]